jgi:hypothetical protein
MAILKSSFAVLKARLLQCIQGFCSTRAWLSRLRAGHRDVRTTGLSCGHRFIAELAKARRDG